MQLSSVAGKSGTVIRPLATTKAWMDAIQDNSVRGSDAEVRNATIAVSPM